MKQINGYWTDENNNRWNTEIYTEEQAEKCSKSLVNCYNCCNCRYCRYCSNCRCCVNCDYCRYCSGCCDCDNGYDCRCCVDCNDCRYCNDCRHCCYCHYCRYCRYCCDCHGCYNYKQNPQRYTTKEIGSRNDQTTFYYGETGNGMKVQIVCGCFRGNLEEFEEAVLEKHKDNDLYREQYLKEIEKVKVLFDLEVE